MGIWKEEVGAGSNEGLDIEWRRVEDELYSLDSNNEHWKRYVILSTDFWPGTDMPAKWFVYWDLPRETPVSLPTLSSKEQTCG